MDLFDFMDKKEDSTKPLAERMRAETLEEFCGQKHIVAENSLLRRAIMLDRLGSCIFWGAPGTGKTTLANIIAKTTKGSFVKLNATTCGVAEIKAVVEEARNRLNMYGKKTYLLLDECHRFSKTQSDSLLPHIEQGTIIFIGSTTENPFVSMTPAIVSRCRIFEFKKLSDEDIYNSLKKALDSTKGLKPYNAIVDEDALNHIVYASSGDLRCAFNALELAVLTTKPQNDGGIHVKLCDAEESIQKKSFTVDKDLYYDMLSAFCKSLRGSDADAALYYAHRLIIGGCDPLLLFRRVIAHSSEDVGMANPNALIMAVSALTAYEKLGQPEGLLALSEAIIYVAESEKSNSVYLAMNGAKSDAEKIKDDEVPSYLRDLSYKDSSGKKEGLKYKYPHDYGGYVSQQYLPNSLKDRIYYKPTQNGEEKNIIRKKLK